MAPKEGAGATFPRRPRHRHRQNRSYKGRINSELDEVLAVVLQFGDGFADIVQGQVSAALLKAVFDFRRPARGQFLERRDIKVAVVEVAFKGFHVVIKEASILANAVAADR